MPLVMSAITSLWLVFFQRRVQSDSQSAVNILPGPVSMSTAD